MKTTKMKEYIISSLDIIQNSQFNQDQNVSFTVTLTRIFINNPLIIWDWFSHRDQFFTF